MKVETLDGSTERRIVIAMIVDKTVLGRVSTKWIKEGLFKNEWSNLIGGWCVKYFKKYGKAPKKNIEGIFESWGSETRDKATVGIVERLLSSVSEEYAALAKDSNSDFITDLAAVHFNEVAAVRLSEAVKGHVDNGEVDKAVDKINTFGKIEIGVGAGIDVFRDEQAMRDAFETKQESLIELSGDLGKFFGRSLERDGFISLLAPEKRGKCIHKDSLVPLANGEFRTIEDIVKTKCDIPVLSLNEITQRFEPIPVSDFWNNGKKKCWKLTTKSGREVITTGNHKYLTPSGWKNLSALTSGDYVAAPKDIPFFGDDELPESEIKFIAYMLADGCCRHNYGAGFTKHDPILVADFKKCCDDLGITVTDRNVRGEYYLQAENCKELLTKHGMHGLKSKDKVVSDFIFRLPKKQLALFLRIYFSCDGYRYKDRGREKVGVVSASRLLIKHISHLLLRFGIVHKTRGGTTELDGKSFMHWEIAIESQESVNQFASAINMLSYKHVETEVEYKAKSFLDKFPCEVASNFLSELKDYYADDESSVKKKMPLGKHKRKGHVFREVFGSSLGSVREQIAKRLPIMRQSFSRFRDKDNPVYLKYMQSHVLWDEVVSIEYVGKHDTYDLTVPEHHNFIADNCVVHNTFSLMRLALLGAMQRRKVAFFAVGDMSQNQMMKRFMPMIARRPLRQGTIKIPTSMEFDINTDEIVVNHKEKEYEDDLDWQRSLEACKSFMDTKAKSNDTLLRLSCHPNSSLNVHGIVSILQTWDRESWSPDIVVIDYADILAPPSGVADTRDQINMTWKQLRNLSQSRHCLVLTATQADAASYKAGILDMSNFSEDKRKLAHVTGMIGLNATKEEKDLGVLRLNWIVRREEEYSEGRCVYCAGCLAIGDPFIKSIMK